MKIQTMSIVCGSTACNAECPFCVSKTTPVGEDWQNYIKNVNWRNLEVACHLAEKAGATTCLITGKGEPTLYPNLITEYIGRVNSTFPFIELQTNGICLSSIQPAIMKKWYDDGLTTVALSAVSLDPFYNTQIYGNRWQHCDHPLEENIKLLHYFGFSVRLSIILLKGYGLDCTQGIDALINFCKANKVEQLTVRPVTAPSNGNSEAGKWAEAHRPSDQELKKIYDYIGSRAEPVLHLSHGATVYDFNGQNICISNCLTTNDTDEDIRQIIFFPDGTIGYDWKYKGARFL